MGHWAFESGVLSHFCIQCLQDKAVSNVTAGRLHVENVFALAGEDGAVVTGDVAVGTAAVKGDTADAAHIVVRHIPSPHGHCVHSLHLNLHPQASVQLQTRPVLGPESQGYRSATSSVLKHFCWFCNFLVEHFYCFYC